MVLALSNLMPAFKLSSSFSPSKDKNTAMPFQLQFRCLFVSVPGFNALIPDTRARVGISPNPLNRPFHVTVTSNPTQTQTPLLLSSPITPSANYSSSGCFMMGQGSLSTPVGLTWPISHAHIGPDFVSGGFQLGNSCGR